jgi:hypothetical protein
MARTSKKAYDLRHYGQPRIQLYYRMSYVLPVSAFKALYCTVRDVSEPVVVILLYRTPTWYDAYGTVPYSKCLRVNKILTG